MITPSSIYWLTRLDTVNTIGVILTGFGVTSSITAWLAVCILAYCEDLAEEKARTLKIAKWTTTIATVGIFITCFIPTTKEVAAMLVIPKIANSEKVQDAGGKLYDLAVEWMDELKPKRETIQ